MRGKKKGTVTNSIDHRAEFEILLAFLSVIRFGMEENMKEEEMIAEIMNHLDTESQHGVYRMSVLMDQNAEEAKTISKQCCNMYGRPASETVGLLDMYTDMNAGRPDNE